jgi:uncharacterized protein (TIGR02271 family)
MKPRSASKALPVAREELRIGKRQVETARVRVSTVTRQHEEVVDQPLERQRVEIEHVPVNRYVDAAPEIRQEGEVTIIPLVEEVLVVEKKLLLREEVRIVRKREEFHQPRRVTLRRQEIRINRQKNQAR